MMRADVKAGQGWRLGDILVGNGAVAPEALDRALVLQGRTGRRIGEILTHEALVTDLQLAEALAVQRNLPLLHPAAEETDPALIAAFGPDRAIRFGVMPLRRRAGRVLVAAGSAHAARLARGPLEDMFGSVDLAMADAQAIRGHIRATCPERLAAIAEARPHPRDSVRHWSQRRIALFMTAMFATLAAGIATAPFVALSLLMALTMLCLVASLALRGAGLFVGGAFRRSDPPSIGEAILPRMAVLVPLLSEEEITANLIANLGRLDYPANRLEVCLVTEEGDTGTMGAIGDHLPDGWQVAVVPPGTIRTKPRALNYALDFVEGDIICVYDAEDAPEPDQLRKVAAKFAAAGPEVVCLQGQLDYYNASQNWLSRCFTLEYAGWFQVLMHGFSRLDLVLPLGGTTFFIRRHALESLGRWDAHNVTEDADLGTRLARRGWRTEMVNTTTYEEANCHPAAWIRQRTRWIKGYLLTWAVAMRRPGALWRDLGPWRFLGLQAVFFAAVWSFLAMPLLWSFWLLALALPHPLIGTAVPWVAAVTALLMSLEIVNLAAFAIGAIRRGTPRLALWAFTMPLYFPLAGIAAWRAVVEIGFAPFHWHKTRHGLSSEAIRSAPSPTAHSA